MRNKNTTGEKTILSLIVVPITYRKKFFKTNIFRLKILYFCQLFLYLQEMNTYSNIRDFNRLFNEYYQHFVHFAQGYVKEKQIAEDCVSEAFISYWENREDLLPGTKPQAYILTVVKNKCLNYLQHLRVRQCREKEMTDDAEWQLSIRINNLQACNPDLLFSDEIHQIIDETLKNLPSRTRHIFILSRYSGLSYREIALQTGISIKTIEFHISKALKQLRLSLKDFICFLTILFSLS